MTDSGKTERRKAQPRKKSAKTPKKTPVGVPRQAGPSFDRIKPPPKATDAPVSAAASREDDQQGKRALFSNAQQPPAIGSVALECSRCNRRSVISYVRLAKMTMTGFHMPLPGVGHRAYLKCPACEQRSWVTVSMKA